MKEIYLAILFIFILQISSVVHAQNHPLAKLWDIRDDQVLQHLRREDDLIRLERIIKPLINESLFGGIYVDVKENKLLVYIKDPTIENLPALDPHRNFLTFHTVNKSLDELKAEFNNWVNAAKLFSQGDHYVYIDIRNNEVFRGKPNKTTNARHPGPSEELHKRQNRPQIIQIIVAGDGILNVNNNQRKTCSVGFIARSHKRTMAKQPIFYVITERNYCHERDDNDKAASFVLRAWNSVITNIQFMKIVGIMYTHNFTRPYNFGEIQWTSRSLAKSPTIRNSDDQNYQELIIHGTRKESETIPGGHICHSGFGTHVTCGNIKAFTGFYLDKKKIPSERLIITDMQTAIEDLGGPVFLYTPENLGFVDLFGIQVTSSLKLTAALSYEIIQDITGYSLYNGSDD